MLSTEATPPSHLRSGIARAEKKLKRDPQDLAAREELVQLRQKYAASKLEDYISRVVAAAPPLSDEQRSRLAVLLNGNAA